MAKKRNAPRTSATTGTKELNPAASRLTVHSYEDIADDQEQYWMEQDQIELDSDEEGREAKRWKREKEEDGFLEASDEEIFAEDDDSDFDGATSDASMLSGRLGSGRKTKGAEEEEGDEEGNDGWWGNSKKDYYNADQIETEADALEEEKEAKRLQKKQLSKMSDADFLADEWFAPTDQQVEEGEQMVTEVFKGPDVTPDMGTEERTRILQNRYPELDYLADDLQDLHPLLHQLEKQAEGKRPGSLEVTKYRILGCYVAILSCYFAILTSPSRDDNNGKSVEPAELRDHEVMAALVKSRNAWLNVKNLKPKTSVANTGMLSPPDEDESMYEATAFVTKTWQAREAAAETKAAKKAAADKAKKQQEIEHSLAGISNLIVKKPTKTAKQAKVVSATRRRGADDDKRSDFGDDEVLDARVAAKKAQYKKTLRFYTSQIVQKASRHENAGRDAGGDMDIPVRERLKDRQARLMAEAKKRGRKENRRGTMLGEVEDLESGGDGANNDAAVAQEVRNTQDEEYYDLVAASSKEKKANKEARFAALAEAKKGERIVEQETVGEDGKRKLTYAIEKNKGLIPKRKKEVRNPRVKKRMRYEDKKKKLKSMRATYKGGEGRGGYQGELSGIKAGLVKSVKL